MITSEAIRMSLSSLWAHKLRSALTILGVLIGIGSVLAVVTLGASFEESIVSQFDTIDQKTIFVASAIGGPQGGPPDCQRSCNIFTEVDRQRLLSIDGVERVIVEAEVPSTSLAAGARQLTYERLTATVPELDAIRDPAAYRDGGPFALGRQEIVLGHAVWQALGANLVAGDTVEIRFQDGRQLPARLAGVLEEETALFGDTNGRVFVPVDPFYNTTRVSPTAGSETRVYAGFTIIVADVRDVDEVQDAARAYLEGQSDAMELAVEDQQVLVATASDIQAGISQTFDQVTIFIGAIAVISLVVGAVGIANIMLVAVAERTREIGVMKALGARDGEVLRLFLLEAFFIGLVGALLGIALGIGLGVAVVNGLFADNDIAPVIPLPWIAISILVGIGTGVAAGFLPALRATRIQPVEALMRE